MAAHRTHRRDNSHWLTRLKWVYLYLVHDLPMHLSNTDSLDDFFVGGSWRCAPRNSSTYSFPRIPTIVGNTLNMISAKAPHDIRLEVSRFSEQKLDTLITTDWCKNRSWKELHLVIIANQFKKVQLWDGVMLAMDWVIDRIEQWTYRNNDEEFRGPSWMKVWHEPSAFLRRMQVGPPHTQPQNVICAEWSCWVWLWLLKWDIDSKAAYPIHHQNFDLLRMARAIHYSCFSLESTRRHGRVMSVSD